MALDALGGLVEDVAVLRDAALANAAAEGEEEPSIVYRETKPEHVAVLRSMRWI